METRKGVRSVYEVSVLIWETSVQQVFIFKLLLTSIKFLTNEKQLWHENRQVFQQSR